MARIMPDGAIPEAYLRHAVPGRSRWAIPGHRGDDSYFAGLQAQLARLPEVIEVEIRPQTGTIVLRHGGTASDVAREAEAAQLFNAAAVPAKVGSRLPDWPVVLSLVFAGLALIQLLRGQVAAPAVTLAWYALNAPLLRRQQYP